MAGLVPATSWSPKKKGVDARVKPGHDEPAEQSITAAQRLEKCSMRRERKC
jgi:hypothetical protein